MLRRLLLLVAATAADEPRLSLDELHRFPHTAEYVAARLTMAKIRRDIAKLTPTWTGAALLQAEWEIQVWESLQGARCSGWAPQRWVCLASLRLMLGREAFNMGILP